MKKLFIKLMQSNLVINSRCRVQNLFKNHLFATNMVITVTISGAGDCLQQRYNILCKRQNEFDKLRFHQVLLTSFTLGPVCHYWYIYLDKLFAAKGLAALCKKVVIDQIIFSPLYIALYIVVMAVLDSKTGSDIKSDLKDKGLDLLKADWLVCLPAQIFNFAFIPLRFRVLYDNTISLGFDAYYSYVMFSKYKHSERQHIVDLPETKNFCCRIPTHSSYVTSHNSV